MTRDRRDRIDLEGLRDFYPEIRARRSGRLHVGDGHELYLEECGDPDKPAAIVLHGGPGGGCSPAMRRFFDPARWRVILFDQRGCGRSRPHGSISSNSTWDLVADMERIRRHLDIGRWTLFGGSWGSTLALAYAQANPERVDGLILRGVFLSTPEELHWFYGGEAGRMLPEAWDSFLGELDPSERRDPISAYYARLRSRNQRVRRAAAEAWCAWETAAIEAPYDVRVPSARLSPSTTYALARMETHYFHHRCFFDRPYQLLDDADRLAGLPGVIVQGRLDLVTPPRAAYQLAERWQDVRLEILADAGHAASEPPIVDGLVRATDALADARDASD